MNDVQEVRKYFGLSQVGLATFLSVSVSLVKMVEQGKRDLPATASLKLARLQQFMYQQVQQEQSTSCPDHESTIKKLQKQLRKYINRYEDTIQKHRKALTDLQARQQEAIHAGQLIDWLQKDTGTGEEAIKDRVWLELLELETKKKWQQYGLDAELLLRWRIDCYEHNRQLALQLLNALPETDPELH